MILTFLEDFIHGNFVFDAGQIISVTFEGGGDLLRFDWQGIRLEIPASVVKVDWQ